jgi:hypothetical protein
VPPPPSAAISPDKDRVDAYRHGRARQEAMYARLLGARTPDGDAILAPVEEPA